MVDNIIGRIFTYIQIQKIWKMKGFVNYQTIAYQSEYQLDCTNIEIENNCGFEDADFLCLSNIKCRLAIWACGSQSSDSSFCSSFTIKIWFPCEDPQWPVELSSPHLPPSQRKEDRAGKAQRAVAHRTSTLSPGQHCIPGSTCLQGRGQGKNQQLKGYFKKRKAAKLKLSLGIPKLCF